MRRSGSRRPASDVDAQLSPTPPSTFSASSVGLVPPVLPPPIHLSSRPAWGIHLLYADPSQLPLPEIGPPGNDSRWHPQMLASSRPPPRPPSSRPEPLDQWRLVQPRPTQSVPPYFDLAQRKMEKNHSRPQKPSCSNILPSPPRHDALLASHKRCLGRSQIDIKGRHGRQGPQLLRKCESQLSSFSSSSLDRTISSSSCSSSSEDPIAYRNARMFPPLLPVPPLRWPSAPRSRSRATNRITAWVSQYEKAQSPAKPHLKATGPTTASEQQSSAEDDDSVVSDISYVEVQVLWQQLKEKRANVGDLKKQMAKLRQELRILRRRQDEADNAFMKVVRPMLVHQLGLPPTSVQTLDGRMTAMQDLRDEHHYQETNYEALESTMDEEERKLDDLETRFFSRLAVGQKRQNRVRNSASRRTTASETANDQVSNMPYELRGISADKPLEDLHPLYVELTSAVGDLEIAKEEYEDLFFIKNEYELEAELDTSTGKKRTAEAYDFFDEFPAEEAKRRDDVSRLERHVESLKKLCEAKKVMRKHMSVRMAYALDPHIKFEEVELEDKAAIISRRPSLAHGVFPELLSQADHVLAEPEPLTSLQAFCAAARLPQDSAENKEKQRLAAKEYSIDSLTPGAEVGGREGLVNWWLLQQLRQSPLNVQLLHSTFVASRTLKIRDLWRWQRDVLYYWWRDSTVQPTKESPGHMASVDSQRSVGPGNAADLAGLVRGSTNVLRSAPCTPWKWRCVDCLRIDGCTRFMTLLDQ